MRPIASVASIEKKPITEASFMFYNNRFNLKSQKKYIEHFCGSPRVLLGEILVVTPNFAKCGVL